MQEKLAVEIIGTANSKSNGELLVETFNDRERILRGLKILLFLLPLSLISVIIPLMHFILPPLLMGLSIFLASKAFKTKKVLLASEVTCPNCDGVVKIYRRPYKFPLSENCESCRRSLNIIIQN